MNKIFFTSDTHYSHKNILNFSDRPYKSVEEMDEELIKNWNSVVDNGDRIYHLGDFTFDHDNVESILKRLNGQKFLIQGNHCKINNHTRPIFEKYFEWIKDYFVLKIKNGKNIPSTKIILSHYPFEVWDAQHNGSLHFYGHVHKINRHLDMRTDIVRRYNVGVDFPNNNFTPIELSEIITWWKDNNLWEENYHEILKEKDGRRDK